MYLQYSNIEYHVFDLCCKKIKCSGFILKVQLPYRIRIRPKKFHQTKFSVGQNFRHQAEISSILSDFCLAIVLAYWTKFSVGQYLLIKLNFRQFCSRNFLSDKVPSVPLVPRCWNCFWWKLESCLLDKVRCMQYELLEQNRFLFICRMLLVFFPTSMMMKWSHVLPEQNDDIFQLRGQKMVYIFNFLYLLCLIFIISR